MTYLFASIPPPPFSSLHLGPLTIRMYGIMIGLGVVAAVWLCGKLMEERGVGTADDAASIAVWGVLAGIVGARFYHVITDIQYFRGNWGEAWKVWQPGLGIPGGILFGTLAGLWAARRRGVPLLAALSCAAPAIPLAQAIGRIGNYFNQELYGRPTTLPWGLRVDPEFMRPEDPVGTLYHPTFLYESLWNLALAAILVWIFRNRRQLQPGRLFPLYMIGYGVGRLWIEAMRVDPANRIGPFRTNIWMSLVLIGSGVAWFVLSRNSTARWPRQTVAGDADADALDDADAPSEGSVDADRDSASEDRTDDDRASDSPARDDSARDDSTRDDSTGDDTKDDDTKDDSDRTVATNTKRRAPRRRATADAAAADQESRDESQDDSGDGDNPDSDDTRSGGSDASDDPDSSDGVVTEPETRRPAGRKKAGRADGRKAKRAGTVPDNQERVDADRVDEDRDTSDVPDPDEADTPPSRARRTRSPRPSTGGGMRDPLLRSNDPDED